MRGDAGSIHRVLASALVVALASCGGDSAPSLAGDTTAGDATDPGSSSTAAAGEDAVDTTAADEVDTTTGAPDPASTDGADTTTGAPPRIDFDPFACDPASPDVTLDRLCDEAADPQGAPDKVFITCRVEGSCAGPADPEPKDTLLVMAYNVERGYHVDEHVAAMLDEQHVLPRPDVLLLSEVDRGCTRTGDRNIAWDYAEGLGMHHVYAVEFVELPRPDGSITAPCEHGNAILSRYPIGNVQAVRHETNKSWYETDEPRLGGRIGVVADILVGDRLLQLHSLHFESGVLDGPIRAAQAAELADLALRRGTPALIGGDTNAGAYVLDLFAGTHNEATTEAFFDRGFVDTHAALPANQRATHDNGLILDIMFTSEPLASDPVVCPASACEGLSDHLPIWASITVP